MGMPGDDKIPWRKLSLPDLKESITQVARGINNVLVLSASGRLFANGQNAYGGLGVGHFDPITTWMEVDTKSLGGPVSQVMRNVFHNTLVLTAHGRLFACGINTALLMGIGNKGNVASLIEVQIDGLKYPIRQVLMNVYTCFVLDNDGQWFACGANSQGQLGVGDYEARLFFTKVKWEGISEPIAQMILCPYITFLITTTGRVFTAGGNPPSGGVTPSTFTEVKFKGVTEPIVEVISDHNGHNIWMRTASGRVFARGSNECGKLGVGDRNLHSAAWVEVTIPDSKEPIQKVVSALNSTYLLSITGKLYACGCNMEGQLGLGRTDNVHSALTEVKIEGLNEPIVEVQVKYRSVFVWTASGRLFVCGENTEGELGLGDKINRNRLTEVINPPWAPPTRVLLARRLPALVMTAFKERAQEGVVDLRSLSLGSLNPQLLLAPLVLPKMPILLN